MSASTCPHCGNRDPEFIHNNDEPPASRYLTMLCVAWVKPEDSTLDKPRPEDCNAAGLVPCGMQWEPNAK